VLPQLTRLKGIALNLLFPQWCVGCGKEGDFICSSCRRSLPRLMPPICPRCGRPQASGILCPACVGWQAEIDGIRSPFRFDGVIRQAIYQLKYRNLRALAVPLAKLLQDYLTTSPGAGAPASKTIEAARLQSIPPAGSRARQAHQFAGSR